ncbi:MAG: hypothetical protein K940chlam1_01265 [Candidatus Anoxychlamydiales bacterium]|nr:hypothetical protein [Candidatus Anoxychlamydiales bacterium]NGX35316.1 hypothetical protein [Candidatus Anoxychlamydiales bacterium]
MSSIRPLKTLCKKAVLKHPKLEIQDSEDGYIKGVLDEALSHNAGVSIINDALKNANHIRVRYDETNSGEIVPLDDKKFEILLGKREKEYYFTKAFKDEIPEKYLFWFNNLNELKKIAKFHSPDAVLVHEFCHAKIIVWILMRKKNKALYHLKKICII